MLPQVESLIARLQAAHGLPEKHWRDLGLVSILANPPKVLTRKETVTGATREYEQYRPGLVKTTDGKGTSTSLSGFEKAPGTDGSTAERVQEAPSAPVTPKATQESVGMLVVPLPAHMSMSV